MSNIAIPKGKKLKINRGGEPITGDIPMVIEEDITISLSSRFRPLLGGADTSFLTLLGSISKDYIGVGFSGQFGQMGFQIWEGTDPVAFTATIGFYMGTLSGDRYNNAEEEVYKPMLALMELPLPREGEIGLIAPGPSILTLVDGSKKAGNRDIMTLEIGNIIRIENIIVKKAEPTFSNETDENDFPIWGKIALEINSIATATVQMIRRRPLNNEK